MSRAFGLVFAILLATPAVAAPLGGSFNLTGTEPFWDAKVRPAALGLHVGDDAVLTAASPRRSASGAWTVWTAGQGGGRVEMRLRAKRCSDGMSDRTYPYEAKVVWRGGKFEGCAYRAGHPPRDPG